MPKLIMSAQVCRLRCTNQI